MSLTTDTEITRLIAENRALREQLVGKWRTMESAPKDGTKVCLAAFCEARERWVFCQDYWRTFAAGYGAGWGWSDYFPTHWMHLPQPPDERTTL